jgi:hypothetical protein
MRLLLLSAALSFSTVGCGYVKLTKTAATTTTTPLPTSVFYPGAQFVSAATVNAVTTVTTGTVTHFVTAELGVTTGSTASSGTHVVITTSGGYTVYQSSQSIGYSP